MKMFVVEFNRHTLAGRPQETQTLYKNINCFCYQLNESFKDIVNDYYTLRASQSSNNAQMLIFSEKQVYSVHSS